MINFQFGKIYALIDNNNPSKNYYGSTTDADLLNRLRRHETSFRKYKKGLSKKYYSSFEILKGGDYRIELVQEYPCNTSEELRKRELYWIINYPSVNKNRPYITEEQRREKIREWHKSHSDRLKRSQQIWREKNPNYFKTYYINHKQNKKSNEIEIK